MYGEFESDYPEDEDNMFEDVLPEFGEEDPDWDDTGRAFDADPYEEI